MKHTKIKDLLAGSSLLQEVVAKGWVRTFRNNQFIALNDGSTIHNIPTGLLEVLKNVYILLSSDLIH